MSLQDLSSSPTLTRSGSAVWQSRAHAAAFAADPSYPEIVRKRQSLATAPVRDLHVPLSGAPQPCIEAPVTEIDIYKTRDTNIEETHELARLTVYHIRSLQPPGFHGVGFGVPDEDPAIGVYLAGWDAVEVRREMQNAAPVKLIR